MKSILAAILIPLTPACIWIDGTTIDGGQISMSGWSQAKVLRKAMDSPPHEIIVRAMMRLEETDKVADAEIQAVTDLIDGKSAKAIEALQALEDKRPGRYSTAANLGTAYEIHGDNHNALKWITEGIRRNPDSHHGTEWLHQVILQTKIELEQNPDYLLENSIVPLPEDFDRNTQIELGGQDRVIFAISQALAYQLQERMSLVKPNDPVVASLLFSYARIIAHTSNLEGGLGVLALSKEYGYPHTQQLETLEEEYRNTIFVRKLKKYSMIAVGIILFIYLLLWMYRRKWFFLNRQSQLKHQNQKG